MRWSRRAVAAKNGIHLISTRLSQALTFPKTGREPSSNLWGHTMQVSQASRPMLNKLDAFEAKIDAEFDSVRAKIDSLRWVTVAVASAVGIAVLAVKLCR